MSDPYGSDPHPYGEWDESYQPMGQVPPGPVPPAYHSAYGPAYVPAPVPPRGPRRSLSSVLLLLVMVLSVGVISSTLTLSIAGGTGSAPPDPKRPSITVASTLSGDRENFKSVLESVFTIAVQGNTTGGTGSGVAIDEKHIVTNAHVVTLGGEEKNTVIQVQDSYGNEYDAFLVGMDKVADVAVLRIDDKVKLTPITFADSENLAIGQGVLAVGAPLGLSNTVTSGIVSALDRPVQLSVGGATAAEEASGEAPSTYVNAIQTDAAINKGNSGGPLIDTNGNLVGLNVAISSAEGSTGSIGIGYAIPSDYVKRIAGELIKNGKASHGLLDVSVVTARSSSQVFEDGALVQEIVKGGAASTSNLRKGDVIIGWDGKPVVSSGSLIGFAKSYAPGSKVTLTVRRGEREVGVEVVLGSDVD